MVLLHSRYTKVYFNIIFVQVKPLARASVLKKSFHKKTANLKHDKLCSGQSPCFHPTIGLNDCLAIIFTTLQAYMIFTYPRLNIHSHKLLNRQEQ